MIAVLIILAVLTVLVLLPVGAVCLYNGETVIRLQIGPGKLQLVPAKPKTPKQRQKAEEKAARKKAEKEEKSRRLPPKSCAKNRSRRRPKACGRGWKNWCPLPGWPFSFWEPCGASC